MRNIILAIYFFSSIGLCARSFGALTEPGDPNQGKLKAKTCAACHGNAGVSDNNVWPNLAGQKDEYLSNQLQAFRNGSRVNAIMSGLAKSLSDQDIRDLAAYFSHLKAE